MLTKKKCAIGGKYSDRTVLSREHPQYPYLKIGDWISDGCILAKNLPVFEAKDPKKRKVVEESARSELSICRILNLVDTTDTMIIRPCVLYVFQFDKELPAIVGFTQDPNDCTDVDPQKVVGYANPKYVLCAMRHGAVIFQTDRRRMKSAIVARNADNEIVAVFMPLNSDRLILSDADTVIKDFS